MESTQPARRRPPPGASLHFCQSLPRRLQARPRRHPRRLPLLRPPLQARTRPPLPARLRTQRDVAVPLHPRRHQRRGLRALRYVSQTSAPPPPRQSRPPSHTALLPNDAVKANFSAPFSLAYVVTLAAHQLTTDLHVTNPSTTDTFTFQALLHTYLRANTALSTVTPFKGLTYINKLKPGFPEEVETREAVDVREPADFVYKSAGGDYELSWGGGLGLEVKASGFDDVVLWNPGKEGRKMSDLEDGGWQVLLTFKPQRLNTHSGICSLLSSLARLHIGSTLPRESLGRDSSPSP